MQRRLLTLDNELDLSEITAIPASEVRDDTYQWFSLFTHVNMVAHLVSAYPPKLGKETLGAISMLGTVEEMSRATLSRALLYLWLFFIHFDQLLWERHGWARFRGWRWRGRYQYRSQVLNSRFRQNYHMLQGIVSDADT